MSFLYGDETDSPGKKRSLQNDWQLILKMFKTLDIPAVITSLEGHTNSSKMNYV